MNKPKVSIIVPVYKTKNTLKKCMESLKNQTLKDIEIILVDDGSPDGSGDLCDSFLKDDRVKVIHKENGGLSSARNAGLKIASGEYIGFVDSDDYVSDKMFQRLYERIIEDNSDICICAHFTEDINGNIKKHNFKNIPNQLNREEILNYLILPLIGVHKKTECEKIDGFVCRNLYKKDIIKNYKFKSERHFFAEDVIANLEIYSKCAAVSIVNECLYYYRYNINSLTNKYRKDLHILLNNLLEFEMSFLINNNLFNQEKERLFSTGVKFVLFSIYNLKKGQLSWKDQINECLSIFSETMLSMSIKEAKLSCYDLKMTIFIILCRLKMVRTLLKIL